MNVKIISTIFVMFYSTFSFSQINTYEAYLDLTKKTSLNQGTISYLDIGEGPVLLLLHGVPTNGWLYRKMIDPLTKAGYRVIIPDLLGYGASDKPKGYEIYTPDYQASVILDFMDALSIKSWSHVCHDAAGWWTQSLLQKAPEKIDNLILLNSILLNQGFHPPVKMRKGVIAKTITYFYKSWLFNKMMVSMALRNGIKDRSVLTKEMKKGYSTPLKKNGNRSLYTFFTQIKDFKDNTELWTSLNIPTSVIWGEYDDILVWKDMRDSFISMTNIPEKDIHILDATHFIQEEKPIEVSKLIIDFLN